MNQLPVSLVLDQLNAALASHNQVLLQAPPGAGKSTYLPLQLLQHPSFADKKILMLEPRRLAARNIARYIAKQLGEKVGETVGYRIKGDHQTSNTTRLEIITEGILTRMLQQDPELADVGLIIFDEYHERSIHADTSLALCLEIGDVLRDDLHLLVMSATLNGEQMQQLMPDAVAIESQGRCYPVDLHYKPRNTKLPLPPQVAKLVNIALSEYDGNILVFLPGASEIKKVASALGQQPANIDVLPLYGQLSQQQQDQAISSTVPGRRKVVLATNIAETSITIEGISLVIDSGLVNKAVFNRHNGVTHLKKEQISQASAEQRAGRAGRVQAGHCWRLWSAEQQSRLAKFDQPQILVSDLLSLALELAKWGVQDPTQLRWLNPPPTHNLTQARQLLSEFGALDSHVQLTAHGQAIYQFGTDPRMAHMMLWATKQQQPQLAALACYLAAVLEQGGVVANQIDISTHLNHLLNAKALSYTDKQIISQANKYRQRLKLDKRQFSADSQLCGLLLAQAFPDRIAKRRPDNSNSNSNSNNSGDEKYLLANGFGASVPTHSHFSHDYIVVADLMSFEQGSFQSANEGRIFLGAELDLSQLEQYSPEHFNDHDLLQWDDKTNKVRALAQRKIGKLTVSERPLTQIDRQQLELALMAGIRSNGLKYLDLTKNDNQLLQRLNFAHQSDPAQWPDFSESCLLEQLSQWLLPYFNGAKKLTALKQINVSDALLSRLDWAKQQQLNQLFPTHYQVASGSSIRLDYSDSQQVKLSVRIQEMFGIMNNPAISQGKIILLIELLSPAMRPIQLTQDLANFWHGSYQLVKKDMKGRYPKHYWPEDPAIAMPTTRVKKHMNSPTKR
ncbi:MAG: ATP-dependent helicase HrpB [Gammaproteobacteria bacterium]|nr:ATP-dependent helicase HrpB [Gammaproteobacteria bacterium]